MAGNSDDKACYLTIRELREEVGFSELKMRNLMSKLANDGKVETTTVSRKSLLNGKSYKSLGYKPTGIADNTSRRQSLALLKSLIEDADVKGSVSSDSEQFRSDLEKKKLKLESSNTDKKYKAALGEIESLNKSLEIALGMAHAEPRTFGKTLIKPTRGGDESEATAFLIASDWHIEERVDPKVINGINEYNPDIARARASRFFTNGARLLEIQRSGVHIDTLVLALLGDIINGYIHEEFVEDNFMSPTEAIIEAEAIISSGIDFLLKNCNLKRIIVPCSYGNHGRTTQKSRVATGHKNNFEWLMYHHLKKYYRNEKRVEFVVSDGYFNYLDVYGHTVRLHHGDYMKYNGGVGGIYIPVNKAISQWNKTRWADLDVFGHWHQMIDGGNFMCNGSLIGYNAFANMIKASYEPPMQWFFLIDNKRGKTISAPIYVDDQSKRKA